MADPKKKPATRFGIPDYTPGVSEDPNDLVSRAADPIGTSLMSDAPPDVPISPPAGPTASTPEAANASMPETTTVQRFGTMIDPTKLPGYTDPNAPVEDPMRRSARLATGPDTLGQIQNDDLVRLQGLSRQINAQNLAANPMLGVTSQSQSGSSTTNQSTTGTSEQQTLGSSNSASTSASEQKARGVTQTVLSDDARESLLREQDIARQRGVVATGLGEAQKEAATISAAKTAEWAEYQKNWAIQQQRAQEAQQVQLARMEKDMQSQQAQYEKAAKEIDPSRLISGPKSWIAALAMGLGAYGSALARTPNYAQQIINQALERDMDAQKIGLQAKKDKMSMTQQILVDMRSRFQSDIAAREATKGAMFGVFASQQEARAQALKGTEAEARSKESALQLAAESQAATSRAFQLESKQVSENNTTGIAQTEGRENSASHTVGTQSQQTHGTTTSTQTGSSYSPASAGVAPVDLVADLNQRTGALAGVAKVAGGPRKTDETKMGTAEEHIRGLIGLQASGRELMRLNAATNFLERKIPWTKLSTEQKVAYQNYKSDERLANTGKGINTAEIAEEYDKFLGSNLTSEGLNAAVRQDMVNGRFKIGSQIATLHPQLKKELVERMRSSGALSDRDMDEILTLRSNEPEAVKGTRLGLTDLNATPARTDKPTPVRDFLNNTLGSYR